jgi:hypothetical protein
VPVAAPLALPVLVKVPPVALCCGPREVVGCSDPINGLVIGDASSSAALTEPCAANRAPPLACGTARCKVVKSRAPLCGERAVEGRCSGEAAAPVSGEVGVLRSLLPGLGPNAVTVVASRRAMARACIALRTAAGECETSAAALRRGECHARATRGGRCVGRVALHSVAAVGEPASSCTELASSAAPAVPGALPRRRIPTAKGLLPDEVASSSTVNTCLPRSRRISSRAPAAARVCVLSAAEASPSMVSGEDSPKKSRGAAAGELSSTRSSEPVGARSGEPPLRLLVVLYPRRGTGE